VRARCPTGKTHADPRHHKALAAHEHKRIGSDNFGEHFRPSSFRHADDCRYLRDERVGVGVGSCSVAGQVTDSQGQATRGLIRRIFRAD
jgi:hypothetical protein